MFKRTDKITFTLSERARQRLDRLKVMTGSESDGEAMRNAMRALDLMIAQAEAGNRIAVVTPSGDVVPLDVFCEPDPTSPKPFRVIEGGKS